MTYVHRADGGERKLASGNGAHALVAQSGPEPALASAPRNPAHSALTLLLPLTLQLAITLCGVCQDLHPPHPFSVYATWLYQVACFGAQARRSVSHTPFSSYQ